MIECESSFIAANEVDVSENFQGSNSGKLGILVVEI